MSNRNKIVLIILIISIIGTTIYGRSYQTGILIKWQNRQFKKNSLDDSVIFYKWTVGPERELSLEQRVDLLVQLLLSEEAKVTFNPVVTNMFYIRDLSSNWKEAYAIRFKNGYLNQIVQKEDEVYEIDRESNYIISATYRARFNVDDIGYVYEMEEDGHNGFIIEDFEYTMHVPEGFILKEVRDYSSEGEKWTFYDEDGEVVRLQREKRNDQPILINRDEIKIKTVKSVQHRTKRIVLRQHFTFINTNQNHEDTLFSSEYTGTIRHQFTPHKKYDVIYRQEDGVVYQKIGDEEQVTDVNRKH